MSKFVGKVAVVTGASAGIGKAVVTTLAKNGTHVIGLARRSEIVEEYAKSHSSAKGKIYARSCDVSNLKSVRSTFNWIEEKFGSMSILVNNAGILVKGAIIDNIKDEDVDKKLTSVMDTNVNGVVYCSRQAYRLIEKSNNYGIIINISSILGRIQPATADYNLYPPSKFAVNAISETMRRELNAKHNRKIRITNVSPGYVETEILGNWVAEESREKIWDAMPHLESQDIADSIHYLLETPYNVNITELTIKPVGEPI